MIFWIISFHLLCLISSVVLNQAKVWQKVIDNWFSRVPDDLLEYLLTGGTRDIPKHWISNVEVRHVFGTPIEIAMASLYTDPNETVEEFQRKHVYAFGDDRPNITQGNLEKMPYLVMQLQGMVVRDIADEYIQEHRSDFPDDEESDEYKTAMRRLDKTFLEIFDDKKESLVP